MSIRSSHLYQLWFPGETLWELWLIGRGKRPELLERCDDFTSLKFHPGRCPKVLALPVDRQLAIPFVSDVSNLNSLQADAKKHLARNFRHCDGEGMGLQILTGKPPRTVVRIDAPVEHSARKLPVGINPDYVVAAPVLIPLPQKSIAIWKELGKQVVAFEQNGQVAYYEELPAGGEFEACLRLQKLIKNLGAREIIFPPQEIHLWNRTSPKIFKSRLKLPTKNGFRPEPTRLKGAAGIRPAWLRMKRYEAIEKHKRWANLLFAGIILAVISAIFFGLFAITSHQTSLQVERLAELRPEASRVRAWKVQWKEVASAVDRDASVLEIWRRLFAIPSANEIRINRMQVGKDMIELSGEAKTVPGAMRFIDDVSKNATFSSFAWKFDDPELRSDGTAYFELVGVK